MRSVFGFDFPNVSVALSRVSQRRAPLSLGRVSMFGYQPAERNRIQLVRFILSRLLFGRPSVRVATAARGLGSSEAEDAAATEEVEAQVRRVHQGGGRCGRRPRRERGRQTRLARFLQRREPYGRGSDDRERGMGARSTARVDKTPGARGEARYVVGHTGDQPKEGSSLRAAAPQLHAQYRCGGIQRPAGMLPAPRVVLG